MTQEEPAIIYVVDDDADLAASVARLLMRHGHRAEPFMDPEALLRANGAEHAHCIVTDVMMDDMNGFDFAERARARNPALAIIFMTAWPTTANAVDSVRLYGGLDYLEKPIDEARLLKAVGEGAAWSRAKRAAAERLSVLSQRERDVFDLLVIGHPNKVIAAMLGISPRTVEDHRASIMAKTGANGLAQLIALA